MQNRSEHQFSRMISAISFVSGTCSGVAYKKVCTFTDDVTTSLEFN